MNSKIEINDRYSALGIPHPDPKTVCTGGCEGMGFYPLMANRLGDASLLCSRSAVTHAEARAWLKAHMDCTFRKKALSLARELVSIRTRRDLRYFLRLARDFVRGRLCDGWHFVECEACAGTGKRSES